MHFQGKLLISKSTTASFRSVVAAALIKIFVVYLEVCVTGFSVAGVALGAADLQTSTNFLIGFLLAAHLLNCVGDHLSFRNWNSTEKLDSQTGPGPMHTTLIGKLDSSLEIIKKLGSHIDGYDADRVAQRSITNIEIYAKKSQEALDDIRGGVNALNSVAGFYLYIWTAALPCLLSAIAICANYSSSPTVCSVP